LTPRFIGRGYKIKGLTVDQTYRNLGLNFPEEGSPDDPARMVGVGAVGQPPIYQGKLSRGEILLLCSDGLHKFLSDSAIATIIAEKTTIGSTLDEICRSVADAALHNGSHDDISGLLVSA